MSLHTWKKEFYPTRANARMSVRKAIQHSIRKWEGLKKTNLRKHQMVVSTAYTRRIEDMLTGSIFSIDSESCALCQKFIEIEHTCTHCPLYRQLGHRCDELNGPYTVWPRKGPYRMIRALKKTLERWDAKTLPERFGSR